jgi:hypothetical protein
MDLGLIGFSAILTGFFSMFGYGAYWHLKRELAKVRAKEKVWNTPALEKKAAELLRRIEAQEASLKESRSSLELRVERLDQARGNHGKRLENLEAVVVGQVWEDLDASLPVATRPHESAGTSRGKGETKELNRRRTAKLARQVDR